MTVLSLLFDERGIETKAIGASKGGGKETKHPTSYVRESFLGLAVVTALRIPCSATFRALSSWTLSAI